LNVDHAQLPKIINTGTKTRNRKSNLRNKDQYHLSSEKHVIKIINYTEKSGILPMSVIIFFSASITFFSCRNEVQAIVFFLHKGSYAPEEAIIRNPYPEARYSSSPVVVTSLMISLRFERGMIYCNVAGNIDGH
jgi:hypothetical protein